MLAGLIRDDERDVLSGHARPERPAGHRPPVRDTSQGSAADRHHPDADAAHRPRARSDRSGPAAVPRSAATRAAPVRRNCRTSSCRRATATTTAAARPAAAAGARRRRSRSRSSRPTPDASAGHRETRRSAVAAVASVAQTFALDLRAERLQPLDQRRVAALDGFERRRPGSPLPPPAPRRSAPSPTAGRGCRACGRAASPGR